MPDARTVVAIRQPCTDELSSRALSAGERRREVESSRRRALLLLLEITRSVDAIVRNTYFTYLKKNEIKLIN